MFQTPSHISEGFTDIFNGIITSSKKIKIKENLLDLPIEDISSQHLNQS